MHKGFRKALGLVQAQKQQSAEQLHDGGSVQGRERQKLPIGRKSAIRDQPVAVGIEVRPVGAIRLKSLDFATLSFQVPII